jgi:hypothetical protein
MSNRQQRLAAYTGVWMLLAIVLWLSPLSFRAAVLVQLPVLFIAGMLLSRRWPYSND